MKKNIFKILCFLALLFPFNGNASTVSEQIDAVMATAWAYYNQGSQLQYDSFRKNLYSTPEDATSKHKTYTVCSGFVFMTYYQTLGIEIPDSTTELLDYAEKRKGTDNVIFYYEGDQIYTNSVFGVGKDYVTQEEKANFISSIIDKVRPGDIYIYANQNGDGHCMMVKSIDKANNKIILIEGNGDKYNYNNYEDIIEANGAINNNVNFAHRIYENKARIGLIRIITDGKQFTDIDGSVKNYEITPSALTRLQYPNIDIGKIISNVSNQSYAGLGDELTFKLTVRNKGTSVYRNITVTENIDSNLSVINRDGGVLNNNQLKWNISTLNPGEYVTFDYTVKVPVNKNLLGKIIVFTGNVGGIATSKIETRIGDRITQYERGILLNSFNKLKSNSYSSSRNFIRAIYNDAFQIDLENALSNNLNSIYYNPNVKSSGKSVLSFKYTNIGSSIKSNLYNNYLGLRIGNDFNSANNVVKASLAWNDYPTYELNDRARTLNPSILEDGDIILAYVGRNSKTDLNLENKGYIYLNNRLYMYKSANTSEEISGQDLTNFMNNLVGENYIILRPPIKSVAGIAITKKPFTEIIINSKYDLSNGEVTVTYDDGSKKVLKLNDSLLNISGFDNTKLGKTTMTIEYQGFTASYDIQVINKQTINKKIKEIKVNTKPLKTNYIYNRDNLDLTGGIITVLYDDGSNEKISMTDGNVKASGFNNKKLGNNAITLEYNGYTTTFDVQIINKSINKIYISTLPQKTTYIYNRENLDLTGGIITVLYDDGGSDQVSMLSQNIKASGFSNTKLGKNTINIQYNGHTTSYEIEVINNQNVSKKIEEILISTKPLKTTYIYDSEILDLTGGIISVVYDDGSVEKINMTSESVIASGFNNKKLGKNKITLRYNGYTTSYEVQIVNKNIIGITVSTEPLKSTYIYYSEILDLTGGVISVLYDDGSSDPMSMLSKNITISGFNNTELGNNTITIEYKGHITSYEVQVVNKKISGIVINTRPQKSMYIYNSENLDLRDGVITVMYDDGSTDLVSMLSQNVKVSGFNNKKVGKNIITVDYNGHTTTYQVQVVSGQTQQNYLPFIIGIVILIGVIVIGIIVHSYKKIPKAHIH